jgi:hypothetical protein
MMMMMMMMMMMIIIIIINCTFRVCQQFDETVDHIVPAFQILGKEQYIETTIL